jgi:hypothetical protein
MLQRSRPLAKAVLKPVLDSVEFHRLPAAARRAARIDAAGMPIFDPGPDAAITAALDWLGRAQDRSPTGDGGIARHYGLTTGWGPSYPETTGYIAPTMLEQSARREDAKLRERARRML